MNTTTLGMTKTSARGGDAKPPSARGSARLDSARNGPQTYVFFFFVFSLFGIFLALTRSTPPAVRETGRDTLRNLMDTSRGEGLLESSRPTMSTARVQTALAALAAEKQLLLSKLAMVDSELEQKRIKVVRKTFQS
jgi:hypothetical protein